jgi:phosphate-selective porin OprO/OprP
MTCNCVLTGPPEVSHSFEEENMKNFRRTALASLINLTLAGVTDVYAADTEALERRIRELESRLEKLDHAGGVANAPAVQPSPEVQKLNQKVNTLERKLEVQDEATTGFFNKLPKFEAGTGGFRISSSDDKHQLRIRGALQTDGRFFTDDHGDKITDRFELKQARVWIEGRLWNDLYYKIMPDFAASNIIPDAYLDYAYLRSASLTVGKMKTPLSLERLQGDSDGTFLERAFPTYLASNRDVGVMLHGEFGKPGYKAEYGGIHDFRNFFSYQVGVFNGAGDDGSLDKDAKDTNDDKEFDGRIWAHPFQHTGYSWLEGLGLGVAGSVSSPKNLALSTQSTPLGRTKFLDYTQTFNGALAPVSDGDAYRIYPQMYWYSGPFGLMGEYVLSSQHLKGTSITGDPLTIKQNNKAWQVLASYVVTGEDNTFQGVKPIQAFNPLDGKWGALQLVARYTELDVDNKTFLLIDPNKSATHASAWTVGFNWYLNNNALIRADYEQVTFKGGASNGGDRPRESAFGTRFQLAF